MKKALFLIILISFSQHNILSMGSFSRFASRLISKTKINPTKFLPKQTRSFRNIDLIQQQSSYNSYNWKSSSYKMPIGLLATGPAIFAMTHNQTPIADKEYSTCIMEEYDDEVREKIRSNYTSLPTQSEQKVSELLASFGFQQKGDYYETYNPMLKKTVRLFIRDNTIADSPRSSFCEYYNR